MKNRPNQYVLDRKSFCGKAAILCLFLAMVFRCVGGLLNLTIFEDRFATVEFLLPVVCCILYILCILIFGRRWFKISVVPFLHKPCRSAEAAFIMLIMLPTKH